MPSRIAALTLVCLWLAAGCGGGEEHVAERLPDNPAPFHGPHFASPATADETTGEEDPVAIQGGTVEASKITLQAPQDWKRKPPTSGFLLAEFALPGAGDAEAARLTVSVAGGSVDANIDRWKSQFGGAPKIDDRQEIEVGDLKVTLVDLTGDFNEQRGPFAPATKRSGYRMIAAIIPVDGDLHFVKCTGPAATIAKHAPAIQEFVRTARRK